MGRAALLSFAGISLASCVPASAAPPLSVAPPQLAEVQPPRPPAPAPTPARPPVPQPTFAWPDAPLSPGMWRYRPSGDGRSAAQFGPGGETFEVACIAPRTIALRSGGAAAAGMTIRTSALERTLAGRAEGGRLVAQLTADDPLLDAMAFSRGRFAVQVAGRAPLVIPAWPELARVVEDCRR